MRLQELEWSPAEKKMVRTAFNGGAQGRAEAETARLWSASVWARQMNADGVLMVAWPLEGDTYAAGVWHQLHIGTLDALPMFLL